MLPLLLGERRRHEICLNFGLNLTILRGSVSIASVCSHSPFYTKFSLIFSLFSHISPCFFTYKPTPSTSLYGSCTLIYPYGFLHIPVLPFFSLLIIPLMNLQGNGLGSSLVKSRSKRSYHHSHSKKLSIKDLALELAKKHVRSISKIDSTFSTNLNGLNPSLPLQHTC